MRVSHLDQNTHQGLSFTGGTMSTPLTEALDAMSYQWLSAQAPELVLAIDEELNSGRSPYQIRLVAQQHVGPDRDGLALRCEQAARHMQVLRIRN
jgi:hypothetical protein